MHPGNFDCFRVSIEQSWRKGADDITTDLKGLMNWRRLVHRAGNRFEILSIKSKGINIAIPPHNIERMMRVSYAGPTRTILDQNLHIFILVDRKQFGRPV